MIMQHNNYTLWTLLAYILLDCCQTTWCTDNVNNDFASAPEALMTKRYLKKCNIELGKETPTFMIPSTTVLYDTVDNSSSAPPIFKIQITLC